MARYKVEGYLDTDLNLFEIVKQKKLLKPGRKPTKNGRLAALILADAWAKTNFTQKVLSKEQRVSDALPKKYSDGGTQRRAIREAKQKESQLFKDPHKPGDIIYGEVGAIWFSDRATEVKDEVMGLAWVWAPGMESAVFTAVKASKGENT